LLLAITWFVRRTAGSEVDVRGQFPSAPPLRAAALLCVVAIFGRLGARAPRARGRLPFLALAGVPGHLPSLRLPPLLRRPARTSDSRAFGIALVVAALVRAALAIYVRHLFPDETELPYATVHADSMLFADAFLVVLVVFFERPSPRNWPSPWATLPILVWGMIANSRRLVWSSCWPD